MSSLIRLAQAALLFLSFVGFYGTWYLILHNGTVEKMAHIRNVGPRKLPGTEAPLKLSYIGFESVDHQLTILALSFWETVDGSMPNASLYVFHFAGQIAGAYGLVMVESMRVGSRWRLVSFVMIWGFLMQNLTYGIIMPLYLALHLSTSKTISPSKENISVQDIELVCTVPSIILGYVVPSILLGLPVPYILSYEGKQVAMAMWQVFPLWVALSQPLLTHIVTLQTRAVGRPAMGNNQDTMRMFRLVYTFFLSLAGVSHISTGVLMLTSMIFPGLFAPGAVGIFNPSKVAILIAIPIAMTASTEVSTIGEGMHLLFQYDNMTGSAAMVLWATVMYTKACEQTRTTPSMTWLLMQVVSLTAFVGPVGCAIFMIWSRDELLYSEKDVERKKAI